MGWWRADLVAIAEPRQIALVLSASNLVFGQEVEADSGHDDTQNCDDEREILNREGFVSGACGCLETHKIE